MSRYDHLRNLIDADAVYLVTGGAGFIGSHLVEALTGAGAEVRVLDDFSTGRRENVEPFLDDVRLFEGSVEDADLCRRACRGVDRVFHQAALPSVQRSVEDPVASHRVGVTGTVNVLLAARDEGVRRVVYAASSSAYGDTEELPKHEEMRPRPRSPYAVVKLAGEHYCAAYAEVFDVETVSLRYFNVFGPRQDPGSQYSAVIPIFVGRALRGRPPVIDGDGEQTRDFTYVENVVRANLLAARADPDGVNGEVFNVGCGDRISVNRLWETIRDVLDADVEATHGPPRPGDVRDSLASLEKIRDRLGFEPAVGLEEGLRRTVAWFRRELEPDATTAGADRPGEGRG